MDHLATLIFVLAILHTFLASRIRSLAHHFPDGTPLNVLTHFLGEVEVVFGLWAAVFLGVLMSTDGVGAGVEYMESLSFAEPLFVFVVMAIAATRPVVSFASDLLRGIARIVPGPRPVAFYFTLLSVGPLLGSLITEPAAMTLVALIMNDRYFGTGYSSRFKYITLGVLFVNISIGGAVTHFAAPPVLMVAGRWGWDFAFMVQNFAPKVILAVVVNALLAAFIGREEILRVSHDHHVSGHATIPAWVTIVHLLFLAGVVAFSHHPVIAVGVFLFFLGVVSVTQVHHENLKIRESLLVAFFLGGLVVLGGPQRWWLEPLLHGLSPFALFSGATALTAVTDNAALTYLGSQVAELSEASRYALVAGAIAGGGLTVIANAPNPAGYSILQGRFGTDGISAARLFAAALVPTAIAVACLWFIH